MNHREAEKLVRQAIDQKRVLLIREKEGRLEIKLEPYLFGDDFLQHTFVWGYVRFNKVYYKYFFNFADSIRLSDETFIPPPETINYYFSDEEPVYAMLDSVSRYRNFASGQTTQNEL